MVGRSEYIVFRLVYPCIEDNFAAADVFGMDLPLGTYVH
jgi:hypothetical protein